MAHAQLLQSLSDWLRTNTDAICQLLPATKVFLHFQSPPPPPLLSPFWNFWHCVPRWPIWWGWVCGSVRRVTVVTMTTATRRSCCGQGHSGCSRCTFRWWSCVCGARAVSYIGRFPKRRKRSTGHLVRVPRVATRGRFARRWCSRSRLTASTMVSFSWSGPVVSFQCLRQALVCSLFVTRHTTQNKWQTSYHVHSSTMPQVRCHIFFAIVMNFRFQNIIMWTAPWFLEILQLLWPHLPGSCPDEIWNVHADTTWINSEAPGCIWTAFRTLPQRCFLVGDGDILPGSRAWNTKYTASVRQSEQLSVHCDCPSNPPFVRNILKC